MQPGEKQLGEMQHFNTTPLGEMQLGEMQFGEMQLSHKIIESTENISTKTILNDENYLIWKTELFLLINIVKIILKSSVKEDLNNYESFQLDDAYVYNKDVKQEMIEKDNDIKNNNN
ncbi:hypothetical protein H8356DRAFT_1365971 [Neocallimastix lanati (nom. inval.)]|nr:hypothetical protein H8356DRAFT_1365971 [Neocallimastix sp. JGI-2020a]